MKKYNVMLVFLLFSANLFGWELPNPVMALYSTTNATQREVAWSTVPGIRYILEECNDLASNNWTEVSDYPSKAEALVQQHVIELLDNSCAFFRVRALDEQPPEMESNPSAGAFGVRRFSSVDIELSDATGIDTNSISLTLGTNGTFSLISPELSYVTNSLVLDLGGDTALGSYGETQEVILAVSDTLGNATNYIWSFELEQKVDAATNLFVFGSPTAQRAGQRLSGLSATVAARFSSGPVRMSSSSNGWEIDTVTSNEVVISYSTNAPSFEVGQMLANLAPAHESEIFYRRIESISDNTVSNLLTLGTVEVGIGEMMTNGSFSLGDEDAVFLEFDENGTLVSAMDINKTIPLPELGADFSGTSIYSSGALDISLQEGCFTFNPSLKVALKMDHGAIDRFEAKLSGDLNISCVPEISVSGSYNDSVSKELWSKSWWYWTAVGLVPVGVEITGSVTANAEIELDSSATLLAGFRQQGMIWVSGVYDPSAQPTTQMNRGFNMQPFEKVPLTFALNGNGNAVVSLVPQIDCRLYGAAGIYVNTNPRLEISGSATMQNTTVTDADFRFGAYADCNVGLSLIGDLAGDLSILSFNYFTEEWVEHYEATTFPLSISVQPRSKTAICGDNVTFSVQASGGIGCYTYQWFQNEKPLPGETDAILRLQRVDYGHAGEFFVKISSGSVSVNSDVGTLSIVVSGSTGPISRMVRIPGGTNCGTDPDYGAYSLTVSSFYMDRTEVTKAQWDTVYNWALLHGYNFNNVGSGKVSNHPVQTVNWYDCVKWCNARSEMGGRTPCYTINGHIYKTGQSSPNCNFNANGYRLPTSNEWEYAARGGLRGKRFPWGDTITHSKANYCSYSYYSYDISPTRSYHPLYDVGDYPYTSPVGSFSPNRYGLYDMSGNVWEWCNTSSSSGRDIRGGGWYYYASYARCAHGGWYDSDNERNYIGFRAVRR